MATVLILKNVFSGGMLRLKAGEVVEVADAEVAALVRSGQAAEHTPVVSGEKPEAEEKPDAKGKKAR